MASSNQQSSSSNGNNEPGHPEELREISFSSESSASLQSPSSTTQPSASSVQLRLSESNLRSQYETISGSPMERWLHENPLECHWIPSTSCAGGIERRGQRPPAPCLPPRLAEQSMSSGNGGIDGSRCVRCNARVCIENIRSKMLKTDVLKLVGVSSPTSFRYVCPVCPARQS